MGFDAGLNAGRRAAAHSRRCRPGALRCAALLAAAACSPAPEVETLPLVLRQVGVCKLGPPNSIELRALGDFPSRTERSSAAEPVFEGLPIETRELEVRTESASGRRIVQEPDAAEPLWLLPSGRSCPLDDPYAQAGIGAAIAPLASGGLLISGGRNEDGIFSLDALVLPSGAAFAQAVPEGMLLRRAWASATPIDNFVVIAGGVGGARSDAHETYEVFDATSASFVGARSDKLPRPRMEHAALLLPGRRILFVGGRASPDGPPLASADLLDFAEGKVGPIGEASALSVARVAPIVLGLDTGSVVVLGGRDASAALVGRVERFDPNQLRFEPLPITLPSYAELVAAALPGGRVGWVGCDVAPAAGSCGFGLLLEQAGVFVSEEVALDFPTLAPAGLSKLQLVALDSGRLLLTGSDPSDSLSAPRAFLIDVDEPALIATDASSVPSALVRLSTGPIAELDTTGTALREQDSLSEYESPSDDLITPELELIALDAPAHWQRGDDGLVARVLGAQLDVPKLRFEALLLELDCSGDVSLSFLSESAERVGAELVDGKLLLPGCIQQRPDNQPLVARLSASKLEFSAADGRKLCESARPAGALRVSLRAAEGATIRRLKLRRL